MSKIYTIKYRAKNGTRGEVKIEANGMSPAKHKFKALHPELTFLGMNGGR